MPISTQINSKEAVRGNNKQMRENEEIRLSVLTFSFSLSENLLSARLISSSRYESIVRHAITWEGDIKRITVHTRWCIVPRTPAINIRLQTR